MLGLVIRKMIQPAQIGLTPVSGKAGDVRLSSGSPGFSFKGEQLVALDTGGGHATLVRQLYIDNVPCFPTVIKLPWWRRVIMWLLRRKTPKAGLPTHVFNHFEHGQLDLPVCSPNKIITVEVFFLVASEWRGSVLGYK